jgi:hypothetical protein
MATIPSIRNSMPTLADHMQIACGGGGAAGSFPPDIGPEARDGQFTLTTNGRKVLVYGPAYWLKDGTPVNRLQHMSNEEQNIGEAQWRRFEDARGYRLFDESLKLGASIAAKTPGAALALGAYDAIYVVKLINEGKEQKFQVLGQVKYEKDYRGELLPAPQFVTPSEPGYEHPSHGLRGGCGGGLDAV